MNHPASHPQPLNDQAESVASPISWAALRLSLLAAALGLMAALAWTSIHRGPWYDEFYTWHVTGPERGFWEAFSQSWLADNHPPLYYILAWFGREFAVTIEQLRLLNLAGLAAALAAGWLIVRGRTTLWVIAAAMLLILAADEAALRNGAEIRSYFLSYCVGAVVVIGLVAGWLEGELRGRSAHLAWSGAVLIGFNLHILTSIILGALLLPFIAAALFTGNRKLLWQLLVPALVAGSVFLLTCAIQVPRWQSNTVNFWIPAGFNAARWSIQFAVQRALEADLPILLAALAGTAMLGWSAWRERRLPAELQTMILLGCGIALASALLIGLHLFRPVVMERYLAALVPAVAAGIALGFAQALRRLPPRWGAALLLAATAVAVLALVQTAQQTVARNSWSGSSALAARVQQACPDSPVHIDPPFWNAYTMSLPPADNKAVFGASHQLMADRHGIRIEAPSSRRISATCPVLFWAEHDTSALWDEAKIAAHLRSQGFAVARVWQYRIGDGWIAADRPLQGDLVRQ